MPQSVALLVAVLMTAAYRWPGVQIRLRSLEVRCRGWVHRPAAGWMLAGLLSLVVNWQLTLHRGVPEPVVQDEYSYLLAGDTFAHGRLTNPTHPLWKFFETFHVLQRPTYMGKYPPGQGLMLAVGQVISGEPIVGVWLEAALLSVSAGWMLFGFLPAGASVLGAVVAALDPLVLQWSSHYWGGTLAAVGGCLVLGAWARLRRGRRWRPGVALGVGISVLVLTRPYEGLLFCSPFVVWALSRPRWGVAAAAIVLVCTGSWLLYDNNRVTGHPLLLPYTAYERQYALAPSFLWQSERPDHPFDRPSMRDFAVQVELPHYRAQRTLNGFVQIGWAKLRYLVVACDGTWITLALLLWWPAAMASDRRLRWAAGAAALVMIGTLASNWTRSQYVAPAVPVLLLFGVAALWVGLTRWPALARGVAAGVLAGMIAEAVVLLRTPATHTQRSALQQQLLAYGGRHLVFVRYLPGHLADAEFVYNAADIDASPVVWAMDRGPEDEQAIRYFAGRTVWLCTVDAVAARIHQVTPGDELSIDLQRR